MKQLDAHALNLMMIQDSMVLIVKDNNHYKQKRFYAHEQKKSTISINFNVSGKTKLTTSQIQNYRKIRCVNKF